MSSVKLIFEAGKKPERYLPTYHLKSQRESLPRKQILNNSTEKQSSVKKANNEND